MIKYLAVTYFGLKTMISIFKFLNKLGQYILVLVGNNTSYDVHVNFNLFSLVNKKFRLVDAEFYHHYDFY